MNATSALPCGRNGDVEPRTKRTVNRLIAIIAFLCATIWLADSVCASMVERKLSTELRQDSNLPVNPGVTAGGFPFVYDLYRGELSSLSVTASDLVVPGFGLVSVQSGASKIQVSGADLWAGRINNAPAQSVYTTFQLDGLALGERLGMTDLTIRRLANIAPNGGRESDAVFTGTPEFLKEPCTVAVRLRIRKGNAYIEPYEVINAPNGNHLDSHVVPGSDLSAEDTERILSAFALVLEGRYLPLPQNPDYIYSEGGSIFLEMHQHNVAISLSDLAPIAQDEDLSLKDLRKRAQLKRKLQQERRRKAEESERRKQRERREQESAARQPSSSTAPTSLMSTPAEAVGEAPGKTPGDVPGEAPVGALSATEPAAR